MFHPNCRLQTNNHFPLGIGNLTPNHKTSFQAPQHASHQEGRDIFQLEIFPFPVPLLLPLSFPL